MQVAKFHSKFLRIILFIHRFTEISYFSLRGMCEDLGELVDAHLTVDMEVMERDSKIELTGTSKTKIVLDKKMNRWTMISLKDGSVILSLDSMVFMNSMGSKI